MFQTGFSCFGREPEKLLGAVKIFIQVLPIYFDGGGQKIHEYGKDEVM